VCSAGSEWRHGWGEWAARRAARGPPPPPETAAAAAATSGPLGRLGRVAAALSRYRGELEEALHGALLKAYLGPRWEGWGAGGRRKGKGSGEFGSKSLGARVIHVPNVDLPPSPSCQLPPPTPLALPTRNPDYPPPLLLPLVPGQCGAPPWPAAALPRGGGARGPGLQPSPAGAGGGAQPAGGGAPADSPCTDSR
jgi:hypothetical protein